MLDVRDAKAVEAMAAKVEADHGRIDFLVNNAAGNFIVPSEQLSVNGWNSVIGIVLNGTFYCASAVGRRMIADSLGQESQEVGTIAIVEEDRLAVVAAGADVMNSSGILDARLSCHASENPSVGRDGQQFELTRRRKSPNTSSEW